MSRYQILIADPLLAMKPQWPEGMHLVERLEAGEAGTHWWLMEDPGAAAEFEGKQVELRLCRGEDGCAQVAQRRVIVTHLVPQDESGVMPCCGLSAFGAPRFDKLSEDKEAVTCGGGA